MPKPGTAIFSLMEIVFLYIMGNIYGHFNHIKIKEYYLFSRLAGFHQATLGNIFFLKRPQ